MFGMDGDRMVDNAAPIMVSQDIYFWKAFESSKKAFHGTEITAHLVCDILFVPLSAILINLKLFSIELCKNI